jgi:RNAse (barnase) inhibitor barstar
MRNIIIDGSLMTTKEQMHDELISAFGLPYYYVRNLDSLYQILSKETDPVQIVVENKDKIVLGYGNALLLLFKDLAAKNKNYTLVIK